MTTNIKITQLTDIGSNLSSTSLVPVVNMSGPPVTQKANLQIVGNLILNNSGNGFPSANSAIFSQSVVNAAQPNITSVGTLTGLTVAGNVNLGTVGNVRILGGAIGQVLTTDGAGNLSWATDGTSYGNSNVALYLTSYTGNLSANIITANIANVTTLKGEAGNLSNITGANVSGTVPYANVANSVAGANVTGIVANATFANTSEFANTVFVEPVNNNYSYHVVLTTGPDDYSLHNDLDDSFQYNPADGILTVTRLDADNVIGNLQYSNGYPAANVVGLGNIATINLTGVGSQVLLGNGSFGAVPGLGNVGALNLTGSSSNVLYGNGVFASTPAAATVDITNTNGLTTVYYPTFVENRTTSQIVRADVDLSYRTDTNTLTVGNISLGKLATFTVADYANLPAATTAGIRAFINDSNLVATGNFGQTVSGGGSNTVPVYSDGSNWCVG